MKKIITESQLRNIIKETVRRLLTEDKVSDYIKKQIVNNSRYSKEMLSTPVAELPKDVRSSMQESAPSIYNACVNHGQNLSAFLRLYFLSYFDINHGKGPVEYVMGLARIAIGELKMFDRNAESDTALLKQVVLFLHNSTDEQLKAQYDGNLNGLDFYTLVRQLNGARREFNAANRTRLKGATDGRVSAYKVVAINSAEEAAKYGRYTSWCVTHSEANYDGYTEGGRRFYFCLRDGFEDVPKRAGEGCPLDDYGLSMISVLVDPEGEPNVITTRWNHENDGENNENLHTAEQVQEVTNIDFYATFKPYSLEQLTAMGITPFYVVQDMLDKGAKPEDIFVKIDEEEYGLRRVYLNNKYNFIDDENKLLFDRWFDFADYFKEGFALVKLNRKYNFINTEGQIAFNQWFDGVGNFMNGFAKVRLNDKYNFINTEGQIAFNQWFDYAERFHEGFATVQLNNKWNFINTEGRILSNQWFDDTWGFSEGFAGVRLNDKWNFINTEGQIAFNQWFDIVWPFSKGVSEVILNGKGYNLDKEGNLTLRESRRIISPTITESQLRNIIKETVRRVLNEGKDANQLADAFVRKNPNIDKNGLIKLLMADPTASQNDRGSFAGKYGVWIGNMYANGSIKPGDAPELKSALFTYDKNKTQLPQIKDCKSLSELIEWVKDLSDDFKPVRKQSKAKADLEKVYEDNEWIVYVPHSHAAARRGGEGTNWCTASENPDYYNMYSKQGPLYINIRKSDGAKFQFHFESNQFMNADDEPIQLNKIGLSEGVVSFYAKIDPIFKFRLNFDSMGDFKEGFALVKLNRKYNFINIEGKLLSKQWFDWAYDFHEGFARVRINDKWNFINTEGQFLSLQWFDDTWDFFNGVARVELNGKYNFINTAGRILSKQGFDTAWNFSEGVARVKLNDKWNFINTKGQLLSNQWFDAALDFSEGFAKVKLNRKYNFINTEGQIAFDQWFDNVRIFSEGFAVVGLNDKWNFINTEGQFLSQQWFDDAERFYEGFAAVQLNNKWNFINTEGRILSKQWFDAAGDFNEGFAIVRINGKDYTLDTKGNLTLAESRRSLYPIITESIIEKIKSECIKRLMDIK